MVVVVVVVVGLAVAVGGVNVSCWDCALHTPSNQPANQPTKQTQTNKFNNQFHNQVINAGVLSKDWKEAEFQKTLAVNFTGAVDCALKLAPHMAPGGLVLAVSSGGYKGGAPKCGLVIRLAPARPPPKFTSVYSHVRSQTNSYRGDHPYIHAHLTTGLGALCKLTPDYAEPIAKAATLEVGRGFSCSRLPLLAEATLASLVAVGCGVSGSTTQPGAHCRRRLRLNLHRTAHAQNAAPRRSSPPLQPSTSQTARCRSTTASAPTTQSRRCAAGPFQHSFPPNATAADVPITTVTQHPPPTTTQNTKAALNRAIQLLSRDGSALRPASSLGAAPAIAAVCPGWCRTDMGENSVLLLAV